MSHMDGINRLPRWDPSNPTTYNYDPSNYSREDYAAFKAARLAAQPQQTKTSFAKLSQNLSKNLQKEIQQITKEKVRETPGAKTRKLRGGFLQADTSGSVCFDSLVYSAKDGGVYADFANPTIGTWFFPLSEVDARSWFEAAPDLGSYFNAFIRNSE